MIKIIKNADSIARIWCGRSWGIGESIEIPNETRFVTNAELIADILIGKAVVNNGVSDITDIIEAIEFLQSVEPTTYDYMLQANILTALCLQHTESMVDEAGLRNCFVDFFQGNDKCTSFSQVQFNGSSAKLGYSIAPTQVDAMDSTTNWSEDTTPFDPTKGTFALDTADKIEGTGSIRLSYTDNDDKKYGVIRTFASTQNWSTYSTVSIKQKTSSIENKAGFFIQLQDASGTKWTSVEIKPTLGWGTINFDITSCTFLSAIKKITIGTRNHNADPANYWVDNVDINPTTNSYFTSGNIISETITVAEDIKQIFFHRLTFDNDQTIVSKISLDGGTTYHTLVDNEFDTWIQVDSWGESFANKRNIKIRHELSTTNTNISPELDDFFIQWKF